MLVIINHHRPLSHCVGKKGGGSQSCMQVPVQNRYNAESNLQDGKTSKCEYEEMRAD